MKGQFKTIHDIRMIAAASLLDWQEEAHALKHGHTSMLRGPNRDMPAFVAEAYARELETAIKAIDEIVGPDPA